MSNPEPTPTVSTEATTHPEPANDTIGKTELTATNLEKIEAMSSSEKLTFLLANPNHKQFGQIKVLQETVKIESELFDLDLKKLLVLERKTNIEKIITDLKFQIESHKPDLSALELELDTILTRECRLSTDLRYIGFIPTRANVESKYSPYAIDRAIEEPLTWAIGDEFLEKAVKRYLKIIALSEPDEIDLARADLSNYIRQNTIVKTVKKEKPGIAEVISSEKKVLRKNEKGELVYKASNSEYGKSEQKRNALKFPLSKFTDIDARLNQENIDLAVQRYYNSEFDKVADIQDISYSIVIKEHNGAKANSKKVMTKIKELALA